MRLVKVFFGEVLGKLTVASFGEKVWDEKGRCFRYFFECECECGNRPRVRMDHLLYKGYSSCGCVNKAQLKANQRKAIEGPRQPRITDEHPYRILAGMKQRCYNPNSEAFSFYGGRGIGVCDEWRNNPKAFVEWAYANGYQPNLTIDRIDNYRGYSPDNCRWVTMLDNLKNRRRAGRFPKHLGVK